MNGERRNDRLLRESSDRQQIKALKYAYCRFADSLDIPGMVSVFTDDCVINFRVDRSDERHGREEAEAFFRGAQSVVLSSSHHLSNMDIVFQSTDRAAMYSYLYSWQRFAGYPEVRDRHRWARYEDVFVRTADGWRQSELLYVVAGELSGEPSLRIGEVIDRPPWTGST